MLRNLAFALVASMPVAAMAQSVPSIQSQAEAHAQASGDGHAEAAALAHSGNPTTGNAQAKPPPGYPPVPPPPAPLDRKEQTAVAMATAWRNKAEQPMRDAEGVLRWMYGSSQARLVCAPLEICDIELKPGEVVNNIRMGDTVFWNVTLAISGGPDGRTTHVSVGAKEAGRVTSMLIYTDQRTYSLKLVSDAHYYTPQTGFNYPEDQQSQQDNWASYRAAVSAGALRKGGPALASGGMGSVDASRIEMLTISGDHPSWRPTAAYTDGRKTYIQFPTEMQYGDSPSLLGVNDDGGLFSDPTTRRVIYRVQGNRLIADTVMDKMKLVLGVGSGQRKVMITRPRQ